MACFPGCHGGEGREQGKEERLGRKEEDMSVGELTKSNVHVTGSI